jgi:drug/metabolite transporter (DMT)-like permease
MYAYFAFLTLIKSLNPYLTKHTLDILESEEVLYLDSILICIMVLSILSYKYFFKNHEIKKTIKNIKKLSIFQICSIVFLAFCSIITSYSIYELDKKHNNPFVNHTVTKITSMILLLIISIFIFNDKYEFKKIIGAIISIIGMYLLLF